RQTRRLIPRASLAPSRSACPNPLCVSKHKHRIQGDSARPRPSESMRRGSGRRKLLVLCNTSTYRARRGGLEELRERSQRVDRGAAASELELEVTPSCVA